MYCPCAGISLVGLDGTLYDQVLDFIFYLGLAPPRFSVTPCFLSAMLVLLPQSTWHLSLKMLLPCLRLGYT